MNFFSLLHTEYLSFVVHSTALCDRCLERIHGAWFRCAYCAKDLCGDCEALDTHDETHLFVVFKAPVRSTHKFFAPKHADSRVLARSICRNSGDVQATYKVEIYTNIYSRQFANLENPAPIIPFPVYR